MVSELITFQQSWVTTKAVALMFSALLLVSCANDYQAPVSEQGERLVVTPPLIVTSDTPDSSLRAANARPLIPNSTLSSASSSSALPSSAPVTMTPSSHRVSRGDTLYSIAFQYDLDARALARVNGLIPPYTIFVDQELSLNVGGSGVGVAGTTTALPAIGVPVSNNSVARAQGSSSAGSTDLYRQPISSASISNSSSSSSSSASISRTPIGETAPTPAPAPIASTRSYNGPVEWQWPHRGRVVRGFDAQTKGIDIDGDLGDPVLAASAGDVVYSGRGIQGAGELIILRHSDRYLSAYAHNSAMLVREGDRVEAGQQIAEVGATQSGDGMLHFEIRVDGKSVDPTTLLPRR